MSLNHIEKYLQCFTRDSACNYSVDELPFLLIVTNVQYVVEAFNVIAERLLGWPKSLVLGQSLLPLFERAGFSHFLNSIQSGVFSTAFVLLGDTSSCNVLGEYHDLRWHVRREYIDGSGERVVFIAEEVIKDQCQKSQQESLRDFLQMMNPFNETLAQTKCEVSMDLISHAVKHLPGSAFMKDAEGRYLAANDYGIAKVGGFDRANDFLGHDDWDLMEAMRGRWNAEFVRSICEDDNEVMRSGKSVLNKLEAPFLDAYGFVLAQVSNKFPLRDDSGRVVGVFGLSLDLTERMDFHALRRLYRSLYANFKEGDKALMRYYFGEEFCVQNMITSRELDCWQQVALGYSSKQVASILNISRRTVESHLIHLREKLGLSSKSDLIRFFYLKSVTGAV
jgi:DNA-binding CsgD family transcriptional regulator/PAS domain-containing protein